MGRKRHGKRLEKDLSKEKAKARWEAKRIKKGLKPSNAPVISEALPKDENMEKKKKK